MVSIVLMAMAIVGVPNRPCLEMAFGMIPCWLRATPADLESHKLAEGFLGVDVGTTRLIETTCGFREGKRQKKREDAIEEIDPQTVATRQREGLAWQEVYPRSYDRIRS